MKNILLCTLFVSFSSCALLKTVRQSDLDSWVGQPVMALDTHSLFSTMPMSKNVSSDIETRVYSNSKSVINCYSSQGYGGTSCSNNQITCSNIFYIKNGKVVEYLPKGKCYTDDSTRPEERYKSLISK